MSSGAYTIPTLLNNIYFRSIESGRVVCNLDLIHPVSTSQWLSELLPGMGIARESITWTETRQGVFIEFNLSADQQRQVAPKLYKAMASLHDE